MLLTEIVSKKSPLPPEKFATTRKEVSPGTFEYTPDLDKSAIIPRNATIVELVPQYEELPMYQKLGLDPNNPPKFPVVHTYDLVKKPKGDPLKQEYVHGLMDALKKRNQNHFMSDDNLNAIYRKSLHRIMNLGPGDRTQHDQQIGYKLLQKVLRSATISKDAIIVPLASSSPVAGMLAQAISEVTKAPIVKMFKKTEAKQSTHVWTRSRGFEPRGSIVGVGDDFQLKNLGHGTADHARGFYDFQQVDPTIASKYKDKIIILVDDNLVTSVTMKDAAKSFFRIGIVPKQIFGIVAHRFE
jgi:hypothetical protein